MARFIHTPSGATFADVDPPSEELLASIPGAVAACGSWLAANRLAARRHMAARYARGEALAREAASSAIVAIRALDGLVSASAHALAVESAPAEIREAVAA